MSSIPEKKLSPPFVSHKSYTNFINTLRDYESLPDVIDKSLMPKSSGSQITAIMSALKYLGHIDETGKLTDSFKKYICASDEERKPIMAQLLRKNYDFLFSDTNFDLSRATTGQVADKFRSLGISGSTVTKAISFFLAAAKDADVNISVHVKAPPPPRSSSGNTTRKQIKRSKDEDSVRNEQRESDLNNDQTERFEIPIPGKSSVQVIVPKNLDADDWSMLQSMIQAYINRWKGFKDEVQ
ncbi:DUF5343 domain-containing protein [Oxalobacter formigenes]